MRPFGSLLLIGKKSSKSSPYNVSSVHYRKEENSIPDGNQSYNRYGPRWSIVVPPVDHGNGEYSRPLPGLTLHGYLRKILARSCQDLRTILAKILSRSCHGTHFAMVRSYRESHVPKKNFIVKSYLARKNLNGSQQKSTSMQIYIVTHGNFLFPRYKT